MQDMLRQSVGFGPNLPRRRWCGNEAHCWCWYHGVDIYHLGIG
ncbi:hypothetical protein GQ55_5G392000 [Panicum hallii var. hallii]|uniref:Uncharacterized protein n=1 Tax=Panicum hallii var. hallii TaxID=1504633 RepID=A0A2T7DN31_9POAL|nr:hypothetical protein GQ55_5G392000 [Panicum hallii var. hallii]